MKYFAQILIRPDAETHERYNDGSWFYSRFKELFLKNHSKIIEETFSAPDILLKLNAAFNDVGITNLVRITHDDTDFYLDKEQITNDLNEVIQEFSIVLRNAYERFFEEISVIMEIKEDQIEYLIELVLLRVHPVGEYPVKINFSGIPQKHRVSNVEEKFKLFVAKAEQSVHKYLELNDITVSITKKEDFSSFQQRIEIIDTLHSPAKVLGKPKCSFFPLYGVTLGETTIAELEQIGVKAKDFDSDKKLYKYYTVKDMRFWYSNQITDHIYMTYTDPLPKQWQNCGFDWSLSYNEWITLFEKLDFFISIIKQPAKEWYNGTRTLSAEFIATKKISVKISISFELDFNYSKKTSVDSKSTLYSLRVRAS